MPQYGVTPAGYVPKPVTVIQSEITASILSTIRADIDASPEQPLGQFIGILAAREAAGWELGQTTYNAFNPGDADGPLLDNLGNLVGIPREGPSPSVVFCEAMFTAVGPVAVTGGGIYPAGSLVAQLDSVPSVQFVNEADLFVPSLVHGSPIGPGNAYDLKDAVWKSTNDGPDYGNALIAAGKGHLTGMVPVAGWASIVDEDSPTLGALEEEDTPYRIRRQQELGAVGACTLDAIAAKIEKTLNGAPYDVPTVVVRMFENTTDKVDPTGLPPHTFEAVVFDGINFDATRNNPAIAGVVWSNKPPGIATFGTTTIQVFDSQGNPRTVSFSRATQLQVYLRVAVAVTPKANQAQVRINIIEALVAASQGQPFSMFGQSVTPAAGAATTLLPGQDVIASAFRAVCQGQAQVEDVPDLWLGFAPSPAGTSNLPISSRQVAVLQDVNIQVDVSVFVP